MTIRRVESPVKRQKFHVYDFEWYPHSLELRCAGHYDGERYVWFKTIDAFMAHVLRRENCRIWQFAHAGGLADFTFLLRWFVEHPEYKLDARFSGSAAVHVEVKRGKDVWIFCDSFFLLRDKLANIMASIGMEKGGQLSKAEHMAILYGPIAQLVDYNENDNVGLYKALERFQEELLAVGGELMPTIASCAMRLFRRVYLERDIRTKQDINDVLREAYIASRVEPIRKSGKNLYQWDINSSFPYSMTKPAPGELQKVSKRVPEGASNCFFVKATIHIPEQHLPPLPYRYEGKVFFPTGTWTQWMSGVDFRLAERFGRVEKVHRVLVYDERTDLAGYVYDIYEKRRRTKDPFQKTVYKYLLNSLYGKFGERTEKTRLVLHPEDRSIFDHPGAVPIFPGAVMISEEREVAHEHVPFAAHVTALSRALILDYLLESGDPYYCDTDCVVTEKADMTSSDALGALKLESRIHEGTFFAPKFYWFDGEVLNKKGEWEHVSKVKAKGFSRLNAAAFIHLIGGGSPDDLAATAFEDLDGVRPCTLVKGRTPGVVIERMARSREMLRRASVDRKALDPALLEIPKTLRFDPEREKRRFAEDGTSEPFDVREIAELWGPKDSTGRTSSVFSNVA